MSSPAGRKEAQPKTRSRMEVQAIDDLVGGLTFGAECDSDEIEILGCDSGNGGAVGFVVGTFEPSRPRGASGPARLASRPLGSMSSPYR
jgi:hypothetical protein